MKTYAPIILVALLAGLNVRGQGSVVFANNSATRVYLITSTGSTPVPAGSQFNAELVFAPDGTPTAAFDAVATRVGAAITFFSPGLFNGGGRTAQFITPAGGFGLFQVRAWETAGGNSYNDVVIRGGPYGVGESAILRVDTGDPTTIPPGTPTPLVSAGLTSFYIIVPEPSVVLLTICGLAAVVFGRRTFRK